MSFPCSEEQDSVNTDGLESSIKCDLAKRLDSFGWGLFFIWVGASFLFDLDWGVALIGVAIITLGGQAIRKRNGLPFETFWVIAGFLFLLGGVREFYNPNLPILPILMVVIGVVIFASAFRRRDRN